MKKRYVSLFLVGAMTLGLLAGCGSSEEDSGDKITINFLNKYPEEEYVKYFEEAVADYEEANPDVDIVMENVSDQAIKDKLSTMAAGGEMPDVFFSWSGEYCKKFARSELALDLTSYLEDDTEWKDGFLPAFLNNSTFDGKTYGIPFRSSVMYMIYNKEIFEQYNLEVPETYDEFLNVCQTLQDNGVTPIGFGNSQTWYSAWWIGTFNAQMVDPETLNADYNPETGQFTDTRYQEAIQMLLDLNDNGYFGSNVNSKDYYQVREEFCAGQVGMIMDATAQFSIYEEAMGDNMGYFKFPTVTEGDGDPGTTTGGAEVYCVSAKSEHPDEAVDFIKFMTSKEQAIKQTEESGLPNCVIGGITEKNASANLVEAYETAESLTNIADWLDTAVEAKVADQYMTSVQEGFSGKSAADIMADVQKVAAEVAEEN